jgi:hypothetical protein
MPLQPHCADFNMELCWHVAQNTHATPLQALKNNAKAKSKMLLSQSCGALQNATPT